MLHLQEVIRGSLKVLAYLMAVDRTAKKSSQDEHVESSLKYIGTSGRVLCHRIYSNLQEYDGRDSTLDLSKGDDLLTP